MTQFIGQTVKKNFQFEGNCHCQGVLLLTTWISDFLCVISNDMHFNSSFDRDGGRRRDTDGRGEVIALYLSGSANFLLSALGHSFFDPQSTLHPPPPPKMCFYL